MSCKHEPWIAMGGDQPRTIGVFTEAWICRICGVLYVSPQRQAEINAQDLDRRERSKAVLDGIGVDELVRRARKMMDVLKAPPITYVQAAAWPGVRGTDGGK